MPDRVCPQDQDLRSWLLGTLPVEATEALLAHLDRCPNCQTKLETVVDAGDTLIRSLRQPWARDELLDEPQFQEAVSRAKAIIDGVCRHRQPRARATRGADLVGELGEYRILEKLGEGGMGTVYKAVHTRLDRLVALKVLPVGAEVSEPVIARFEREMKAVGGLDHPHIVRALDAREIGDTRFLVLEYIDGVDLAELIRQRGPLPVADACRLVRQAAEGLQYAHQHDLIHRDVKPSNLMVDTQGELRILDLGLARLRSADSDGGEMTRFGQTMGTAEYMAPEQAWDSHSVDIRADVYGLGGTLYYLLNGRAPYTGETDFQLLTAHHERPIPSLRAERDDVPEALDRVFRRMMAKTPAERQTSMAEVIADLDRCLAALPRGDCDLCTSGRSSSRRVEAQRREPEVDTLPEGLRSQASTHSRSSRKESSIVFALFVGAIAGAILLAGIILKLKTPMGTLILSVDPGDAEVLIDDGQITITTRGDVEPTKIRLEEGEYKMSVNKGGFETHTESFSVKSGDREVLKVKLVPLTETGAAVAGPTSGTEDASGWNGVLPSIAGEDEPPPLAVAPFTPEQAQQHQQAWADYLGVPVRWNNRLGMEFVLIPPGEFLMGSAEEEQTRFSQEAANLQFDLASLERWIPAESPPHRVRISQPFYLGTHEVTQAQWEAAMGNNPSIFKAPDNPVENVSWHDIQLLLKLSGPQTLGVLPNDMPLGAWVMRFTLPTEAQWEYACRAGTTTAFCYGDVGDGLAEYAWFYANSEEKTHAVGQLAPNAWGLYDIHGNVWEWCADRYEADYYQKSPSTDPLGPADGLGRVFRGGCWGYSACYCRSAFRRGISPDFRYQSLGFRLAAILVGKR